MTIGISKQREHTIRCSGVEAAEQSEAEGIEDGLFLAQLPHKYQCFNPLRPQGASSPFQVEPLRLAATEKEPLLTKDNHKNILPFPFRHP